MLSTEARVNYYTANLDKKWDIDFNKKTGQCYYKKNDQVVFYEAPLEHQHGTFCINKDFTVETFKKICLDKFYKRIGNEKNLPSIDIAKNIINYNTNNYILHIIKFFNADSYLNDKSLLHRIGDVYFNTDVPIITKTRPIEPIDKINNVIINLESNRHWYDPIKQVEKEDIPFNKKNNKIIWRGENNGMVIQIILKRPIRYNLVKRYHNHPNVMIDIGYVADYIKDNHCELTKDLENIKGKGFISIKKQLQSKFIISVEGGDIATSLKWILYSNSVVIMPKPTMCSWLMEDKLIPWVHYVPLDDDFGDTEEKYNWCLNNIDKCEEIAKNGKKYIEQFLDEEREAKITNLVLRKYVDNVSINLI